MDTESSVGFRNTTSASSVAILQLHADKANADIAIRNVPSFPINASLV